LSSLKQLQAQSHTLLKNAHSLSPATGKRVRAKDPLKEKKKSQLILDSEVRWLTNNLSELFK